jgi:hypothetical protein
LAALPPYYRRNVYVLTVGQSDTITVEEMMKALQVCQTLYSSVTIDLGLVKRNIQNNISLEEQRTMFNQVRFSPVHVPDLPHPMEPVACRAFTAIFKHVAPAHLGGIIHSGYKPEYKDAHFEKYGKIYRTGA